MNTRLFLISLFVVAAARADVTVDLLDADLGRFEIWMGVPHATVTGLAPGVYQSENVKEGEPLGLNADPKQVFSVQAVDGTQVLKITGEIYAGLTTREAFENYHFSTQFKWGEKKWEPRLRQKRDSGILYHCEGEHGEFWKVWKRSLEFQVQEADLGDFIGLSGPKALIHVSPDGERYRYDPRSNESLLTGRYTIAGSEPQKPHGEWNLLELYTIGQTSIHVVNGVVVMVLQDTQRRDGSPLTRGQLQIQSEAAECYYKKMHLRPIARFPDSVLSQIPFDVEDGMSAVRDSETQPDERVHNHGSR